MSYIVFSLETHIFGANSSVPYHDDVIKWKHIPRYWPFVRGIHRSPVTSDAELWYFNWSATWINGWVNSREACDLRRHRAHYDATVMTSSRKGYLSEKVFIPFELNDKDHSSLLCDPDPDLHYFNSFNQVLANSNYFTEAYFKEHINKCCDKDAFSMCHLNIRSISKNLSSLETYIDLIRYNFTIIGLTETRLNDTNYDLYGLHGYHFIEQHRSSTGGGVALCIMKHLNYIERPDLTIFLKRYGIYICWNRQKTVIFWKKYYYWCSISSTWKWYQDIQW